MINSSFKKILIIFLLIGFLYFLFGPLAAHAQSTSTGQGAFEGAEATARVLDDDNVIYLSESLKHGNIAAAWGMVLDFVNIVAIFLLLAIAFANILHINVEEFHVKRMLPALIIGLIVANLSHLICRAIVDFAIVLQAYFIPREEILAFPGIGWRITEGAFGGWGNIRDAASISGAAILGLFISGVGTPIACGVLFLAIILIFFPALALLILGFLLYIRVFIIWFLVIASPIIFFGSFLPPLKGIVSSWWNQFLTWVFMAPIAFFVIWVTLAFVNQIPGSEVDQTNFTNPMGITRYLFTMAMLVIAIVVPIMLGGKIMGMWAAAGKWLGLRGAGAAGGLTAGGARLAGGRIAKIGEGWKDKKGIKGNVAGFLETSGKGLQNTINPAYLPAAVSGQFEKIREADIKKSTRGVRDIISGTPILRDMHRNLFSDAATESAEQYGKGSAISIVEGQDAPDHIVGNNLSGGAVKLGTGTRQDAAILAGGVQEYRNSIAKNLVANHGVSSDKAREMARKLKFDDVFKVSNNVFTLEDKIHEITGGRIRSKKEFKKIRKEVANTAAQAKKSKEDVDRFADFERLDDDLQAVTWGESRHKEPIIGTIIPEGPGGGPGGEEGEAEVA